MTLEQSDPMISRDQNENMSAERPERLESKPCPAAVLGVFESLGSHVLSLSGSDHSSC